MEWWVWITWWITFCIRHSRLLWIYLRKHKAVPDNPSIKLYVNKTENKITFEIKTGYNLELLTSQTMKLLGITKSEITKDKNGVMFPHLEFTEIVLVQFNIVNNGYQHDLRVLF